MFSPKSFIERINFFRKKGRTENITKNIAFIFLLKIPTIIFDLFILRLTLSYLEPLQYGIWITLLSIVGWLNFSDLGISSGLRNLVAESLARKDLNQTRIYISTTYAIMVSLSTVFVIVLVILNSNLSWASILNTPKHLGYELNQIAFWMIVFGSYSLTCNIIKSIFKAIHIPFGVAGIEFLTSISSITTVYFLINVTKNSLFYLSFSQSLINFLIPGVTGLVFFLIIKPELRPSWRYVNPSKIKKICSLGGRFFVIQASSLVIFSTDSLILSQITGPESVSTYHIVFKYFHVLTLFFATVSMPFWSAFTDAHAKNDYGWIRRAIITKIFLLIPFILAASILIILGNFFIEEVWLGRILGIEYKLLIFMGVYVVLQAWNRIFSWFLSGIGDLSVQLYSMVLGAIVNIPLSIIFAKHFEMGSSGVILGTIVSLSIFALIAPFKTVNLVRAKT